MDKQKLILGLFVLSLLGLAFLISNANASEVSYIYEENKDINLKIPCSNDGAICSTLAQCNITVLYPNSTTLIDNKNMTNLGNGFFNLYLNGTNETTPSGTYTATMFCEDGGLYGSSPFSYLITFNGKEPPSELIIVFFSIIFIAIIVSLMGLTINNLAHFVQLDFDMKDLIFNISGYIGLIIFYILEVNYMGSNFMNTFLVWTIGVGALTFAIFPIVIFIWCLVNQTLASGDRNE